MPEIVTATSARRLQAAVNQFKKSVPVPAVGKWQKLSDAELWAAVLGQIAVVGGEKSGHLLKVEIADNLDDWYQSLKESATTSARLKSIHRTLRKAGVRYVTDSAESCRKSQSASHNFELLEAYGGPTQYFRALSGVPEEAWRIGIVSDEMQYIRSKGARDLLIGLGLAENVIALDSRLQTVLKKTGISVPSDLASNRGKYKSLERELLEKVCKPCSISGAHFDRILFSKWKEIA